MSISPSRNNPLPTRILLIEDNDVTRLLMRDYLVQLGFEVFSLAEVISFPASLHQFQPDIVLLDLKLPNIDGYALLQQLQHHSDWKHIPIIVISAFAFSADIQRALDLGARRYLVKPVKLTEVIEAIQAELNRC